MHVVMPCFDWEEYREVAVPTILSLCSNMPFLHIHLLINTKAPAPASAQYHAEACVHMGSSICVTQYPGRTTVGQMKVDYYRRLLRKGITKIFATDADVVFSHAALSNIEDVHDRLLGKNGVNAIVIPVNDVSNARKYPDYRGLVQDACDWEPAQAELLQWRRWGLDTEDAYLLPCSGRVSIGKSLLMLASLEELGVYARWEKWQKGVRGHDTVEIPAHLLYAATGNHFGLSTPHISKRWKKDPVMPHLEENN